MMPVKKLRFVPMLGAAALGIGLALWMFISGCGKDPVVPAPPSPPPEVSEPEFTTWDKPAAALILTGEQNGYIEPCGCSETQSGGLARRADLIKKLTALGWPVAGLDLGGSLRLAKSEASTDGRGTELLNKLQAKLKFKTQLKAMQSMRYSALALGFEELKFGAETLLNDFQPQLSPQGSDVRPAFLASNLLIFGSKDLGPRPVEVVTIGDVKVGVTAVVGESIRKKLYGDHPTGFLEIQSPAEMLPQAIETLKTEQTGFNVLLSHATPAETKALIEQFPDFDIALCQSGEEGRQEPETVGNTLLLQVGRKGKHTGVLAYYPDGEPEFRFELVELDNKRFENDQSIEPFLVEYQNQLKEHELELYSSENMTSGFHPQPGEFVGAETCGQCHTKAYDKWKSSKHAHAYETLKTGREGQYSQPISRVHDPECLSCHVTGWDPQGVFPFDSGFLPEAVAEQKGQPERYHKLQGQQCENCHGPGSEHVRLERTLKKDPKSIDALTLTAGRRQMVLSKVSAEQNLCKKCHDFENSPKFDFDKYWEKIKHPWRD